MPNKTLRDIAIEIGINVNTLKSRIYRAEMAGRPKARRDHESKRRKTKWLLLPSGVKRRNVRIFLMVRIGRRTRRLIGPKQF